MKKPTTNTPEIQQLLTRTIADEIWRLHGPDSIDRESAELDGEEIAREVLQALGSQNEIHILRDRIVSTLSVSILEDHLLADGYVDKDKIPRLLWFTLADRILATALPDIVKLDAAVERVRAIHQPREDPAGSLVDWQYCSCRAMEVYLDHDGYNSIGPARYPCATVRALNLDDTQDDS